MADDTSPEDPSARKPPPDYDDVIEHLQRARGVGLGLLAMLAGGLLVSVAVFAGAPAEVVVALALLIPGGLILAGVSTYPVARSLGAGRARSLWYTMRLGLRALLDLT